MSCPGACLAGIWAYPSLEYCSQRVYPDHEIYHYLYQVFQILLKGLSSIRWSVLLLQIINNIKYILSLLIQLYTTHSDFAWNIRRATLWDIKGVVCFISVNLSVSNLKEIQEDTNQLVKELAEDTVNKFEEFFKSVSEGFEKFFLHWVWIYSPGWLGRNNLDKIARLWVAKSGWVYCLNSIRTCLVLEEGSLADA